MEPAASRLGAPESRSEIRPERGAHRTSVRWLPPCVLAIALVAGPGRGDPLDPLAFTGQSFELGTILALQSASDSQPAVDLVPRDLEVIGSVTVPSGGATNLDRIDLGSVAADVSATDPIADVLANAGVISGTGSVATTLVNEVGGEIDSIGGSLTFTQSVANDVGGQINGIGASFDFAGGLASNGDLNLINSVVSGSLANDGVAELAGSNTFNADVTGAGDFMGAGTAVFAGSYSPGASAAEAGFGGSVTLADSNLLSMELGGTTPGSGHDHLDVAGAFQVGGQLLVLTIDGFEPQLDDSFDLFDFGSSSGSFSDILLPDPGPGLAFDTSSLLTTGVITVPEPEPSPLMALGVLALLARLSKRRTSRIARRG